MKRFCSIFLFISFYVFLNGQIEPSTLYEYLDEITYKRTETANQLLMNQNMAFHPSQSFSDNPNPYLPFDLKPNNFNLSYVKEEELDDSITSATVTILPITSVINGELLTVACEIRNNGTINRPFTLRGMVFDGEHLIDPFLQDVPIFINSGQIGTAFLNYYIDLPAKEFELVVQVWSGEPGTSTLLDEDSQYFTVEERRISSNLWIEPIAPVKQGEQLAVQCDLINTGNVPNSFVVTAIINDGNSTLANVGQYETSTISPGYSEQILFTYYIPENWEVKDYTFHTKVWSGTPGSSDLLEEDNVVFFIGESNSTCQPNLISPLPNSILDNGCFDGSNYKDRIVWNFDWQDCAGASQYNLYVNLHSSLSPFINIDGIEVSSYDYTKYDAIDESNLEGWTWKVRAMVNGSWGSWSEERTFSVEPINTDCPTVNQCTPVLLSPSNGALLDNGCIVQINSIRWNFDWDDCTNASKYNLYVYHPSLSGPIIDITELETSFYNYSPSENINDNLLNGWKWKVRAMVNGLWGSWSEERTFEIEKLNSDCGVPSTFIDAEIVTLSPNKTRLVKDTESIAATVTIKNTGNISSTFYIGCSAISGNGPWYSWSPTRESIFLDPGKSGNVIFNWIPSPQVSIGRYGINVAVFKNNTTSSYFTEKWVNSVFEVVDISFKAKVTNISLNKLQFSIGKDPIEAMITIKNESNKIGRVYLRLTATNISTRNSYDFYINNNIDLNPYEERRISNISWVPFEGIKSGEYRITAKLIDPASNLELSSIDLPNTLSINNLKANIRVENTIESIESFKKPYIIWSSDYNTSTPLKICADGSTSTQIIFSDSNNSYDLSKIKFIIEKDPNNTNVDLLLPGIKNTVNSAKSMQ